MKKIALMTWHHAENYGTAYQAYALKTLIEQQGFKVDLINYNRLDSTPISIQSLYKVISSKFMYFFRKKGKKNTTIFKFKKETFEEFYSSRFSYTTECLYNQDFNELNRQYDGFVCGSDQIWGPNWYDGRFFLDFVTDVRKLIAYAPSFGVTKISNPEIRNLMKYYINRFAKISVREKSGCEIIKKLTGRHDIYNVLDPVLMLNSNHWQQLEEPFVFEGKYALIFFLANNPKNIQLSIESAKKKGLKAVVLHCTQTEDTPFANTQELTPGQMLTCIRNSEFVFTDSFHVSVLSIIFHRQLMTFSKQIGGNKNQYKRITDLFERLQINGGVYHNRDSLNQLIDYSMVDKRLDQLRKESITFLSSALQNLPENFNYLPNLCNITTPCKGEYSDSFNKYINTIRNSRQRNFMIMCQFALEPKCYRCKFLQYSILRNGQQPLFYSELQEDLNKLDSKIYIKYYRNFDVITRMKKLRHVL